MLKLIQYIKGYVIVKVWGFSPERFMNLCSNHHLFLWDITNRGDHYTMCISLKDFYKLKPITKKTGTRAVIQKRCGLPFFIPGLKRRKFFIIGLLGSIIFWMWMSGYIWAIELQGNYYVTEDELMEFMSGQNIYVGMKQSEVHIEELEKALRRNYEIVTWTSARIDGTRLVVQIKENDLQPIPEEETSQEDGAGYDLAAVKDGTVVSIITRMGVPLVAEGSEVKKGDILVQGGVPILNDDLTVRKYQYCVADADIYLQCKYEAVEILPIRYEEKQYSGKEKKVPVLDIFGHRVKLGLFKNPYTTYDVIEDIKQVKLLDDFYLPIYYGTVHVREYTVTEKKYSSAEAKAIFSSRIAKIIKTLREKGVQIIEKNVTMKKDIENWYMNIDFDIIEKTGKAVPTQLWVPEIPEPASQ